MEKKHKGHYKYNSDTLTFDKVDGIGFNKRSRNKLLVTSITLLIGVVIGALLTETYVIIKNTNQYPTTSKHDLIIGSSAWRDSTFSEYAIKANLYLNREEFNGTPIKGEMLALAAENAYDSTGVLLPVELCLAQCQWESGMGLKGKSPINNPFNIGEYDTGTVLWFDSTFEGVQSYFYFMTSKYLRCSTISELFENFVNCGGHRYASGSYEEHIPKPYYYIVGWLKDN